jgi:membrane fusion protein, multidrug efflux system
MFKNSPPGLIVICLIAGSFLSSCSNQAAETEKTAAHNQKAAKTDYVDVVKVQKLELKRQLEIPGELRAFQNVAIEAKVEGYVSWIGVDRGSKLKKNDKMLTIFCPELEERVKENEAKYSTALAELRKGENGLTSTKSKLEEAKARFDADSLTLDRLRQTQAKMAGSVAQNDIDVQTKTAESDQARIDSMNAEVKSGIALVSADQANVEAAKKVLDAVRALISYLTISAPFDGVITERNVHVGSMVGFSESKESALVRIQQRDTLRLVVALPEDSVAGLKEGQVVAFNVPAFLGEQFHGTIARPAYALDEETRTMPVELNVKNNDYRLEPGMFATVYWPVSRPTKTLFVPETAVATDLKGTFVNIVDNDTAKRVSVRKGQPMGGLVEIVGNIKEGDEVALTASNELDHGTHLAAKLVSPDQASKQN